jgi:large conductance mechanosensitive channel
MKKFFGEFKTFITRGNVLDMAVGVIVGGAFTGIVNGLSNYILKPIINFLLALILGENGLTGAVSVLSPAYDANGALDLAHSIYIDWGAFISAIINFFLIAFVLFTIVKVMNRLKEENGNIFTKISKKLLSKEDRKAMKAKGLKLTKANIEAFLKEKDEKAKEEARIKDEEAKRKAEEDRKNNPTVEDLLKDIKAILSEKK